MEGYRYERAIPNNFELPLEGCWQRTTLTGSDPGLDLLPDTGFCLQSSGVGVGRRKGTQEGLFNTCPNFNSTCALGNATASTQGRGDGYRHFSVPLDRKPTTVLKNNCHLLSPNTCVWHSLLNTAHIP